MGLLDEILRGALGGSGGGLGGSLGGALGSRPPRRRAVAVTWAVS